MTQAKEESKYKYLHTVPFSTWLNWDVKSYATNNLKSKYDFVKLDLVLNEQTEKVKLKDFPDQEFGILGVNNKIGIFDAYLEKGSKINQPYKIMKTNWIAYNPYRVNVGSVGIKTENQKYEYISNAYVVFSCQEEKLNTDFFFRLFKTNTFNNLVKKSTKGSVRQNLSFDLLSNIQIPLPPISTQKSLVAKYDKELAQARKLENKLMDLNQKAEDYLLQELGITIEQKTKTKGLSFVSFKDLNRWDTDYLLSNKLSNSSDFPLESYGNIFKKLKNGIASRKYSNNGIKYLTVASIKNNSIDNSTMQFVSECKESDFIKEGTLLITRKGTVGQSTIVHQDKEYVASSEIFIIELEENKVNKDYISIINNSKWVQKQYQQKATGMIMPSLSQPNLKSIQIPLPPIDVQNKIVKQIENIKNEADKIKEEIRTLEYEARKDFETNLFDL